MASIDDLKQDVQEFEKLLVLATRQQVKSVLMVEIHKLKALISNVEAAAASKTPASEGAGEDAAKPAVTRSSRPVNNITTYAWDQSDKFFKIYVTVKGVQDFPKENITTEFTDSSFKLRVVSAKGNVDHVCYVTRLHDEIITDKSYHKVKSDTVLVMLKKKVEKTWPYITQRDNKKAATADKKPPAMDDKDPQAGLMDMMKQMYDDGDDEMKRTISKAMFESQNKQSTVPM